MAVARPDDGGTVVRGGVTTCVAVAVAVALAAVAPASAQAPPPAPAPVVGRPVEKYPLPTDTLFAPRPAVPPRTAFQPADQPDFTLPDGAVIPVPQGKAREFRFTRRYGTPNTLSSELQPDGSRRFIFTGGVIISASTDRGGEIELATDDAVVWVRGLAIDNIANGFRTPEGTRTEVEAYLAGNVIVRTRAADGSPQTLRAGQVYYDVERDRAVALGASLEVRPRQTPEPIRLRGDEVRKLDPENWEVLGASFDGSRLPSDPGLRIDTPRATLNQRRVQLRNVFGVPYRDLLTGEPIVGEEKTLTAYGATTKLAGVPVFYLPRLRTDPADPLGPLGGLSFSQNRMFGTQVYTSWQMYELLALRPPPGHSWNLNADYLSERGPAIGTDYLYTLPPAPGGLAGPQGLVKLYGMSDRGEDILGGFRGPEPTHPDFRGRALWRHQQEILEGMYFQGQVAYLSDKNFLEQFYKQEFDFGPNQETFAYLTWQRGVWGAAGLAEYRLDRPWVEETQWLPRLDGAVTGKTFLNDLFVYSATGNVAYARSRTSNINPLPILPTDVNIDTGRIDFLQELSVPFSLGPFKLAPYGTLDLAGYTEDLTGETAGRVWGGGGLRASLPLSRLYDGAASDLFNVRGLYHKAVLATNYLYARSNVPYTSLPLLDRLNDDATDQAWRNMTEYQTLFVPGPNGTLLAGAGDPNNPFNPQRYLIRRLNTSRPDTIDDVHALQLELRQRFQTKRGYPGLEHTVDVLTFNSSATWFPEASRDNFGNPFAFLEYGALWNVGDRTAVTSSGWFEPYSGGSRYYNIGVHLNRPDRTMLSVTYRQTDPLNSRAVSAGVGYQFTPRYGLNLWTSYDFGLSEALSNTVTLTRTGSDLTFMIGVSYNSLQNNTSFQFAVLPNLVFGPGGGRAGGGGLFGPQAFSRR